MACENLKPGNPESEWQIDEAGSPTIEGFATDMSVNAGSSISFKVRTNATAYALEIYRIGYYQGLGARRITTISPSAPLPQNQPTCLSEPATNLLDCGNWAVSATWAVPSDAVSGVYVARLVRPDTNADSHVSFVVRADSSHSDLVFQTSDTTWQAYNTWGGTSLYQGPDGRGTKVSYNRPFATRGGVTARDFLFANEYPMIRFLERNGFDMTYTSGVDSDRRGNLLQNHKTFLSVGHDEYWSGDQRNNVEAAREAGVNLAFFSGNEAYWKTRWEPSIDGSATDHRTLVCFKETQADAKTDPSSQWTGTWRDPRFSPPADGGRPENALTGTAYMSNFSDLAIKVSAAEGKQRLWRHTSAAALPAGGSQTLAPHSIGYESDEDLDNGFRPAGLIRTSTTTGPVPEYLLDYGSTVAPGTTTHHLTMYRASSGALVFGAGTVQWAWGLDASHDGTATPVNATMQQATVNMLADMGAQPTTLMGTLTRASASPDPSAPTVNITSPAPGTSLSNGVEVTVTGTATDAGGGVPAGVEVSTDGGSSWHPAEGTTSWSYRYIQQGNGPVTVKVRATDDSLNTSAPVNLDLAATCPCSLFGAATPSKVDSGDAGPVELGVRFRSTIDGWVTGVRFHKATANTGTHVGSLWSATGALLARGTFSNESASGWQTLTFPGPIALQAGTTYIASYSTPTGHYSVDDDLFRQDHVAPPLIAPKSTDSARNGVYGSIGAFPTSSFRTPSYGVDLVFTDVDTAGPSVVSSDPVDNASSVPVDKRPGVVFSEAVSPASLQMTLTRSGGATVPGAASYDAATRTATFSPSQSLSNDTSYTLTVRASDASGNAMPPTTSTFRSARPNQTPGVCPCTVWDDSVAPAVRAYPDPTSNELGMRFSTQVDGVITGVRFYKGVGNTGTHTGSLWTTTGTRLATATFANESAEGWQDVSFTTPVPVTAGTTYVVSYHAPDGRYAVNVGQFSSSGVASDPLVVPAGAGAYVSGSGYPAQGTSSNYWVQPVFTVPAGVKPTVTSVVPAAGSTNVRIDGVLTATFDTQIQAGSAALSVQRPGGAAVTGTTTYDAATRTAAFTPGQPLDSGTAYQFRISDARSLGGAQMDPVTVAFTTASVTACPCTAFSSTAIPGRIDAGDGAAVTLGLKFVPTSGGNITGVRFYKAPANTGTHTGSLWTAGGQRLATVTFTGESASGWQTMSFPQPVDVTAGQTYVVSYFAPNGHYAADLDAVASGWTNGPLLIPGGGNGVYRYGPDALPTESYRNANYWVDPIFATGSAPDSSPPSVVSQSPVASSSSVPASTPVSVTFSEPIAPASLSITVTDAQGAPVAGNTAYDPGPKTGTFTAAGPLARGKLYTAKARATDLAGNAMGEQTWTFTTMQPPAVPGVCPCSLWDDTAVPSILNDSDGANIEVGVQFTVDLPVEVTGVRFYKGTANLGTHVGSLWSATGERLAQATFADESSTGWQSVTFAQPVPAVPGTTYIASYSAPQGHYSATIGGLSGPVDNSPLHTASGAGRYQYGGGFPSSSSGANYWVTPVVADQQGGNPTPPDGGNATPVISSVNATAAGSSLTVTWRTDIPATTRVDYGTAPAALSQSVTGASGTDHTVVITGLTPNTRYYYRVTSAAAVNPSASATWPAPSEPAAVFAPAPTPFVVDSTTQLAAGTLSNTVVSEPTGGVVTLRPNFGSDLSGTALPSGLSSTALAVGGSTTVATGLATIAGSRVRGSTSFSSGSVTWNGTLASVDQRIGWYGVGSSEMYAVFGRAADGTPIMVTTNGRTINSTQPVAVPVAPGPHEYRVDWTATTVTYFVDGTQVGSSAFAATGSMRIVAQDTTVADAGLIVDWVRVGPFTASGTYTSQVLDASTSVAWDSVVADAAVPPGATLAVQFRAGSTATPGTGWSAWAAVPASGTVSRTARYGQFRLVMTTTGTRYLSPTVSKVTLNYHLP